MCDEVKTASVWYMMFGGYFIVCNSMWAWTDYVAIYFLTSFMGIVKWKESEWVYNDFVFALGLSCMYSIYVEFDPVCSVVSISFL